MLAGSRVETPESGGANFLNVFRICVGRDIESIVAQASWPQPLPERLGEFFGLCLDAAISRLAAKRMDRPVLLQVHVFVVDQLVSRLRTVKALARGLVVECPVANEVELARPDLLGEPLNGRFKIHWK
jgi:hypothetical protein